MVQACRGYAHLHAVGYLHLDIKPENVLVEPVGGRAAVTVLVADFGMAAWWKPRGSGGCGQVDADMVHSELYRPWDLFHAAGGAVAKRPRLDAWAFGCLVFDVCYEHPRQGGNPEERPRLYTGISMSSEYESVVTSRNYRLTKHLRARGAALVTRCQDLLNPRLLHARMEDNVVECRGVDAGC